MGEIDPSLKEMIHNEVDKEVNIYPIKLSWKQLYAGIIVALGLISGIFGAGYKVNNEVNKVEIAKLKTSHEQENRVLITKLTNAEEEAKYFQGRYNITYKRLSACQKKEEIFETYLMTCPSKDQVSVKEKIDRLSE